MEMCIRDSQENARNKSRKDTCGNSNADEKGQVAHKGCALHEHHGRKDLTAVMGEGTEAVSYTHLL